MTRRKSDIEREALIEQSISELAVLAAIVAPLVLSGDYGAAIPYAKRIQRIVEAQPDKLDEVLDDGAV